jgi:hypothetical protein
MKARRGLAIGIPVAATAALAYRALPACCFYEPPIPLAAIDWRTSLYILLVVLALAAVSTWWAVQFVWRHTGGPPDWGNGHE